MGTEAGGFKPTGCRSRAGEAGCAFRRASKKISSPVPEISVETAPDFVAHLLAKLLPARGSFLFGDIVAVADVEAFHDTHENPFTRHSSEPIALPPSPGSPAPTY